MMHIGTHNFDNRLNWIKRQLKKIPKGKRILDAGAGEQQYKKYCKHLVYTSQDFCQYDVHDERVGLHTKGWDTSKIDIVSDIINIPVKNEVYDAVLCTEVLEHIPNPIAAIGEFSRILKPRGKLILTAPFCSLTHMAPYYYSNGFSEYWYREIMSQHGFEIEKIEYNGNYFEYFAQELRRVKSMKDGYTKPPKLFSLLFLIFYYPFLNIGLFGIQVMSKYSKDSERLLCLGLHVTAIKK